MFDLTRTGVSDEYGHELSIGDVVQFRFTKFCGEPGEPEVGYPGTDEFVDYEAYGLAKFSPYRGVYFVHGGRCHQLTRSRWFLVIGPDSEHDHLVKHDPALIESSRRTTWEAQAA